ncbi:MAG TPA: glycosyltransferase, partial [Kofleriaceae bacterium]|nr:glycosyltransferase [Kofleriaceae bacterium]
MFVLSNLGGGGAERVALLLAGELARRGHAITLFVFKREGALWNDLPANVRVRAVVSGGATTWPHAREIWRALTEEAREHDVVVGALEGWPTLFALGAARRAGKPCVGWIHADYRDDLAFQLRFLWVTRLLDRVVCVSAAAAAAIRGCEPRVIHNAVVAVAPTPRPHDPVPVVLAIGRLSRVKRFDLLIDAHARMLLPHRLAIVGDGAERAALAALATRLGVEVEMPGYVADLDPWYRRADVVVSCSRSEGFSLVVAEALARGV